ncbi:hypothetical protein IWQ57_006518, partial [Coemansia nantahalensis]
SWDDDQGDHDDMWLHDEEPAAEVDIHAVTLQEAPGTSVTALPTPAVSPAAEPDMLPGQPSGQGKWLIPVTLTAGDKTVSVDAELDTGASCTMVSRTLIDELGCAIRPAPGSLAFAVDNIRRPRVGTAHLIIATPRHHLPTEVEVLPGQATPPVLIGRDVLNSRASITSLLSVVAQRPEGPDDPATPDFPAPARENDSEHRAQLLVQLADVLADNAALDLSVPCPLPEAQVTIPTVSDRWLCRRQPILAPDKAAIVDTHIAEQLRV